MAINITTDILHSSDGKVAKVQQIAGGWQTLATKSDFNTFTTNSTTKQNLTNGQLFYVLDESTMYKLTVAGFPVKTYTLSTASLGTINTSSLVTTSSFNAATSSFVLTSQTGSFIIASQTSSMSVLSALSASFISDTFISASAARSGFGAGGSTPDGTISSSAQISALGYITSSDANTVALNLFTGSAQTSLTALNIFTGSAQTSLTALNAATSSYLTSDITSSFILVSQTSSMNVLSALTASFISDSFISASAARSGFGSSTISAGTISSSAQITALGFISSSHTDVSAINTFTGSAQTSLTALNAATSSYLTSDVTASFVTNSQTSSMSVATASYVDPTFISASVAAAGFGAGSTDISALNTFTGSAQTSLTALNAATSSYITNSQTSSMSVLNALTASFVSDSFISASAARSGFGSGGSTIPTGTVSSSTQTIANLVGQDVVVSSITAETYIISSSVSYITTSFSSGSTIFGDSLNDTHQVTGSLIITGSISVGGAFNVNTQNLNVQSGSIILTNGSSILVRDTGFISASFTGSLFGTSSWAVNAITASYINPTFISASVAAAGFGSGGSSNLSALNAFTASAQTSLTALNAATASYITNSQTSSMTVLSASYALNGVSGDGSITTPNWNISADGVITLAASSPGTATTGSIYFDGTNFYFGV